LAGEIEENHENSLMVVGAPGEIQTENLPNNLFGYEERRMRGKSTAFWFKNFEDRGVDGRTILKLMLKKQDGRVWPGFMWLRMVSIGGLS
jgi:hypothetical protein